MSPIALAIRQTREALGISRAELARHLGVTRDAVAQVERSRDVRESTMRAYAKALGVDVVALAR